MASWHGIMAWSQARHGIAKHNKARRNNTSHQLLASAMEDFVPLPWTPYTAASALRTPSLPRPPRPGIWPLCLFITCPTQGTCSGTTEPLSCSSSCSPFRLNQAAYILRGCTPDGGRRKISLRDMHTRVVRLRNRSLHVVKSLAHLAFSVPTDGCHGGEAR